MPPDRSRDSGRGRLTNWLAGENRSRGKIDVYGYRLVTAERIPGTSVVGTRLSSPDGVPEPMRGVDDLTMPVGTGSASVRHGAADGERDLYYLEPQAADGFIGWHVMVAALRAAAAERGPSVYPVFMVRR